MKPNLRRLVFIHSRYYVSSCHSPLSGCLYICNFIKNEVKGKSNMPKLRALPPALRKMFVERLQLEVLMTGVFHEPLSKP